MFMNRFLSIPYFLHYNILRIFAVLFLIITSSPFAKAQISTDQAVNIGRNVWYFDDYVLSIWYFNQAIQAKPYLAEPYLYRAIAKINLEDFAGAEADASAAIERNPFITDAWEVRGVARQNLGKDSLAIGDYNHALKLLPRNRQILFNKAMAQTTVEDFDGADSTFTQILTLFPSFENARLGRARLNLARKDTVAALNDVNETLRLNDKSFNAYAMRADLLAQKGKAYYKEAISDIDAALKLHPRSAGLYINRAYMEYSLDDYFSAMADYDHALQLEPYNKMALFNRGLLNAEVNANDRALEDFNRVIQLDPDDIRARYCRSRILANKRQFAEAIADVNHVIAAYPDFPTGYYMRSDFNRRAGNISAANADYARANRISHSLRPDADGKVADPAADKPVSEDEAARREFASLLTVKDNTDMREEYNNSDIRGRIQDRNVNIEIEPIVELAYYSSPTELNPDTYFIKEVGDLNSARVLRFVVVVTTRVPQITDQDLIDRHFQSIADYNSYLSTHKPRAVDYIGRALDFLTLRNYSAALADLNRAISLNPEFAPAYMLRAQVRINMNNQSPTGALPDRQSPSSDHFTSQGLGRANSELILSDLDEAIRLSPLNPYALYNKGNVLISLGDFEGAEHAYSKAIELKPTFGEAYYNRGYARLKMGKRREGVGDLSKAGEYGVVAAYNLLKRYNNFQ